jgi:hypothetical protein
MKTESLSALVLVSMVLFLPACARRATMVTTYTLPPSTAPSWVGVRVEDVVKRWGSPSERTADGEGGTILTYRTKSSVRVSSDAGEWGGMNDKNEPGSGYRDGLGRRIETEIPRAPTAVFYVSAQGSVYRYSISAAALASGKVPDPPAAADSLALPAE